MHASSLLPKVKAAQHVHSNLTVSTRVAGKSYKTKAEVMLANAHTFQFYRLSFPKLSSTARSQQLDSLHRNRGTSIPPVGCLRHTRWRHLSVGVKAPHVSLAAIFLWCAGADGLWMGQSDVAAACSDVVVAGQGLVHEVEKGVLQHTLHQVAKLRKSVDQEMVVR